MNLLEITTAACLVGLAVALLLVLYRVLQGPTVPDRVAALDLAAIVAACSIGVLAIRNDKPAYLDVAVVLALLVFLGTVAFARYLERRALQQ